MIRIDLTEEEFEEMLEGFSDSYKSKYPIFHEERKRLDKILHKAQEYKHTPNLFDGLFKKED